MAQSTQFANPEALTRHQQTLDYGKKLIAHHDDQGLVLDTIPPAWTPFRAHLSEALDYVEPSEPKESIADGLVVACIIDENCGERTYLDSEIAIFEICNSASPAYGAEVYMEKRDRILKCWEQTWKSAASLVLIQAPGFPSQTVELGKQMQYAVLDHFRVSLIWTEENEDGEHVYMARLEKCNLQSKSWWTPRQSDPPAHREFLGQNGPFTCQPCSACGQRSPRVYKEAMLCLTKTCPYFCTSINAETSEGLVPGELTFDDGFLLYRSYVNSAQRPPFPLIRNLLNDLSSLTASALSHSKMLLRGIVCARCRSIVPKAYWHIWSCEECPPDDNRDYSSDPGTIDLEAIVPRTFVSYHGHPPLNFQVPRDLGQEIPKQYRDVYVVDKWTLHNGCQLVVLSPTSIFNEHKTGPNMIFTKVLKDANSGALRLHRHREQEPQALDDHYQSNWGAEYGYYGFQESLPLHQAPASVSAARGLLDDVANAELRNYSNNNAVQVLGFMQDQGLQWHTDGEGELGDTVLMLNLGGNAIFKLRLQKAHYSNENAFAPEGEVVRGAKNWEKAMKIKAMAAQGRRPTDADLFEFSHGQPNVGQSEAHIPLIHGSIVIMQGLMFSNYYEHCVETSGPLTFAVITRTVHEQQHEELLNTKYAINSERPNGPLFTSSYEDPGEVERSPSPETKAPIPIVVQHVRPRPAPMNRQGYLAQGHHRSASSESGGSSASSTKTITGAMRARLLDLKDGTDLTYEEIKEQEGWDCKTSAMSTALKRERDDRTQAGIYNPPSRNASPYSRSRRKPKPASEASGSGLPWTQEELDQLWELRHEDPPREHKEIAALNNNRRTEKAYREQMVLERKRRGGLPLRRTDRRTTQQRRTTLTATRERVAQRDQTPDFVPPVPQNMANVQQQQTGSHPGQGGYQTAQAPEEDEDGQPVVRRLRGSGQRNW